MVIVPSKVHYFHHTELSNPKAVMDGKIHGVRQPQKFLPPLKGMGFHFGKVYESGQLFFVGFSSWKTVSQNNFYSCKTIRNAAILAVSLLPVERNPTIVILL